MKEPYIVLVEDCELTSHIISLGLESHGFIVEVVHNGREAYKAIKNSNPDLVVMDVELGKGITGIDVARKMNDNISLKDTPVIFISSHDLSLVKECTKCLGVAACMEKPIDLQTLLRKIKNFISICKIVKTVENISSRLKYV